MAKGSPQWLQLGLSFVLVYLLLHLLYSAGKLLAAWRPSRSRPRIGLKAALREAGARFFPDTLASLYLDPDERILSGLALAAVGGRLFLRAPAGTGFETLLPFSALAMGALVLIAALHDLASEPALLRFRSVLTPGSGWSVSGNDEISGRFSGRPVRVRFGPPVFSKDAKRKELSPGHSEVRITLPGPAAIRLCLHQNAHWPEKELREILKPLPAIKSIGVGEMRLHGAPPEEAEALVQYWLANGFNTWRLEVKRTLGLRLAAVRLWDDCAEFAFEGRFREPVFYEAPPLRQRLEGLLKGCLRWCAGI